MLYSITNFVNSGTLDSVSSEDSVFTMDKLYNNRPSYPFRFTGKGSIGNPEWACCDMGSAVNVTLACIFNHNLVLTAGGDELALKGCSNPCQGSGACNWDVPGCEISLINRLVANFENLYGQIACGANYRYWRVDVIDQNNPHNVQWGELFLGQYQQFSNARLQPGRKDGPRVYRGMNISHMGQLWHSYFSNVQRFSIRIMNLNDPNQIDELLTFIQDVHDAGGFFVFIPNESFPICHYVFIENETEFAEQLVSGPTQELREWRLELISHVKGIYLLG